MTKTHVLGGEISNFSAGLCEGIVIVSVCSRQINCIILVLRLLYHSEEPSPATQRQPVTPRNAFPRGSWITREPHSAKALSLPALLRRCSDMTVIFHGKKPPARPLDVPQEIATPTPPSFPRCLFYFIEGRRHHLLICDFIQKGLPKLHVMVFLLSIRTSRKESNSWIFYCSRKYLCLCLLQY